MWVNTVYTHRLAYLLQDERYLWENKYDSRRELDEVQDLVILLQRVRASREHAQLGRSPLEFLESSTLDSSFEGENHQTYKLHRHEYRGPVRSIVLALIGPCSSSFFMLFLKLGHPPHVNLVPVARIQ
jgi:hypothetical protein